MNLTFTWEMVGWKSAFPCIQKWLGLGVPGRAPYIFRDLSLWGYVGCWHNDLPGPCRSLRGVHPAPSSAGGSWFTMENLEDLWEKQKKTSLAPGIISCVIFLGGCFLFSFFFGGGMLFFLVVSLREGIPWVLGD